MRGAGYAMGHRERQEWRQSEPRVGKGRRNDAAADKIRKGMAEYVARFQFDK